VSSLVHANISLELNRGEEAPPFGTESLCVEGTTSAGYPDSSLKPLAVFS
jgi:hypothetical protein